VAFFLALRQAKVFAQAGFIILLEIGPMLRKSTLVSGVRLAILAAMLLACPSAMLAQRGAGGGHTGGGTAGGGGLSGGTGRATGLDEKDELKDFHLALAIQATSQQIVAYNLMMQSTDAANTEWQAFVEHLGAPNTRSEIASRGASLDLAIENARAENRKFLGGLSEQQKSGLKEILKKLSKSDSDLEQQSKTLSLEIGDAKSVAQPIAASAQNLGLALTSFRSQQIGLGEEMSIRDPNSGQNSFDIPAVKNSVSFANQPIVIATSGVVTRGAAVGGQSTFKLALTADLSDLQRNLTDVLRAELDQADPCGERIEIRTATVTPREPASLVLVQLHFERWSCRGRETMNETVDGNGAIEVKLTPTVGEDGSLRLLPEIGRVDAEGLVGSLLRSGSLGETLRDKITESVLSTVRQGGDFKATLPPAAQGFATLQHVHFQGTGSGKLSVVLEGEIRVPNEKVAGLTSELKGRSPSQASSQETPREAIPR
jgi:hypothetical protein